MILVTPVPDNEHESETWDDISNIAEDMAIVSKWSPWVEAQVVVVAGVQVAGHDGSLLVVVDQLEHRKGVVNPYQYDQP